MWATPAQETQGKLLRCGDLWVRSFWGLDPSAWDGSWLNSKLSVNIWCINKWRMRSWHKDNEWKSSQEPAWGRKKGLTISSQEYLFFQHMFANCPLRIRNMNLHGVGGRPNPYLYSPRCERACRPPPAPVPYSHRHRHYYSPCDEINTGELNENRSWRHSLGCSKLKMHPFHSSQIPGEHLIRRPHFYFFLKKCSRRMQSISNITSWNPRLS